MKTPLDFSDKKNWPILALAAVFVLSLLYAWNSYSSYNDWQEIASSDLDTYMEGGADDYMDYALDDLDSAGEYENQMYAGGLVALASGIGAAVLYKKRKV